MPWQKFKAEFPAPRSDLSLFALHFWALWGFPSGILHRYLQLTAHSPLGFSAAVGGSSCLLSVALSLLDQDPCLCDCSLSPVVRFVQKACHLRLCQQPGLCPHLCLPQLPRGSSSSGRVFSPLQRHPQALPRLLINVSSNDARCFGVYYGIAETCKSHEAIAQLDADHLRSVLSPFCTYVSLFLFAVDGR